MADATTAARDRIDRALALLERRLNELKAAPVVADDALFAVPLSSAGLATDKARIAELEAAGQEASRALAQAAEAVRAVLSEGAD